MKTPAPKLTKPQRRELEAGARHPRGIIECYSPGTLPRKSWRIMMEKLRLAGLVDPYVSKSYRITDAGRREVPQ